MADFASKPDTLKSLPAAYLDRMQELLGNEYGPFLESYQAAPQVGLRVNTLKLSPEQFTRLSPFPLVPIPWCGEGFLLDPDYRPGKHPYHAAGLYYLQDPSAMAAVALLDPQPGERILDLAAAPGGKTSHIAAQMKNQGVLVSNDISARRVRDLCNNLERWGARNVLVTNETPGKLADHFGAYFDRVLVDAPCSGEGMFRKDPPARQEWSPKLVERCAVRQDGILADGARMVKPGGKLVYATCTFAPEENEGTLLRFLDSHPDFEVCAVQRSSGFSPGRPDWVLPNQVLGLEQAVRLWPHKAPGEGHFMAVLQRSRRGFSPSLREGVYCPPVLSKEAQLYFTEFASSSLNWQPEIEHLSAHGAYLYLPPAGMPDLHGLRVVHWGWWLGSLKVRRFEPSHALGMALQPGDVQKDFPLEVDDPQTMKYLHGEVLSSPGEDGWVMVSVDGYPLGWAKRVQGRLKSRAPRWLRWM